MGEYKSKRKVESKEKLNKISMNLKYEIHVSIQGEGEEQRFVKILKWMKRKKRCAKCGYEINRITTRRMKRAEIKEKNIKKQFRRLKKKKAPKSIPNMYYENRKSTVSIIYDFHRL